MFIDLLFIFFWNSFRFYLSNLVFLVMDILLNILIGRLEWRRLVVGLFRLVEFSEYLAHVHIELRFYAILEFHIMASSGHSCNPTWPTSFMFFPFSLSHMLTFKLLFLLSLFGYFLLYEITRFTKVARFGTSSWHFKSVELLLILLYFDFLHL